MINARKRIVETTVMFAIPIICLNMLSDISVNDAKVFPKYICYLMIGLAIINAFQLWIYLNKIRPIHWPTFLRWSIPLKGGAVPFPMIRVGMALALMTVYVFCMETVGFYLSGFLFFLATLLILDPDRPTPASAGRKALYALSFMAVVYFLFSVMLGVMIPGGIAL